MNVEWKAILDALMEGAEYINIYSYRLSDGSYIMAEEMNYDPHFDIIFIDLPVTIHQKRNGVLTLDKWMFQSEPNEDGTPADPVELNPNKIIAKVEAPISLKREYIKYNFLYKMYESLDQEEFESLMVKLSSHDLDKKDPTIQDILDINQRRLRYPDHN